MRAHLEISARKGSKAARRELERYQLPDEVLYLWNWAYELYGRSGAHMNGLNPVSYTTIQAWAAMTGHRPTSLEVEALIQLDTAMMYPDTFTESDDG